MYLAISEAPSERYPQGRTHWTDKAVSFEYDPVSRRVLVTHAVNREVEIVYDDVNYLVAADTRERRNQLIDDYRMRGSI